ncbi:hypothetical protein [Erythrobacter sp. HKB08]|uniref:hypothetical protein n=1 Tax=Erythrobacter sp. HKB08 TaxID=2502843 RepID=UPI0010091E45|nr:hypothetical protein [Erythrobacter sp. HKB08]
MSAPGATGRRGGPIAALLVIALLWIGGRALLWESPFPLASELVEQVMPRIAGAAVTEDPPRVEKAVASETPSDLGERWPMVRTEVEPLVLEEREPLRASSPSRVETFASHQVMWLAGMSRIGVPEDVAALIRARASEPQTARTILPAASPLAPKPLDRWAFDGWLLYRPGSQPLPTGGAATPSYGGSQAGGVLSYRLAPASAMRPAAMLRINSALAGPRDEQAAVGLSLRPLADIPLRAQAEMRLVRSDGGIATRPAVLVVSELPPVELPLGTRADAYVQAGYVGGADATGFVDGSAKLTREIADFDLAKLSAGAGAWGGAQKGVARLDVGPSANLDLRLGSVPARVSLDFRHRVAGNAESQSGIALTLSTGF